MPNDSVAYSFLKGNAAPDAIDKLNSVFPDPKSATQSLKDFIASEVQRTAVDSNGTVNLAKMNQVLAPYQNVLNKMPFADVRNQFRTVQTAQQAVDQLTARQKLFDTFNNDLGTNALVDNAGNKFYAPAQFTKFANANQDAIKAAYGADGVQRINQIADQLTAQSAVANSRVAGTSGTAQTMTTGHGSGNVMGMIFGDGAGVVLSHMLSPVIGKIGAMGIDFGAGVLTNLATKNGLSKYDAVAKEVFTKALADPTFAKSLLTTYNPKMPTTAGNRALQYVGRHLAGYLAPVANMGQ